MAFRKIFKAALFLFSVCSHANVTLVEKNDWQLWLGGFAEVDLFNDATRSFTEFPGSAPVLRPDVAGGANGRTQLSIRNSRLNIGATLPNFDSWKPRVLYEFDFLGYDPAPGSFAGAPSENAFFTNPTLRVRHVYLSVENSGWTILAGQYWNLFGWQPYYFPGFVSVSPMTGEVYARNPQIRVSKQMSFGDRWTLEAAGAIVRPVQRDSQLPGADVGLRVTFPGRTAPWTRHTANVEQVPMSLGLSATARDIAKPVAGSGLAGANVHFVGSAFAIDTAIPVVAASGPADLGNTLILSGEFSRGSAYADQFPNWTGNQAALVTTPTGVGQGYPNLDPGYAGVDAAGVFSLLNLQTWNASLQYRLPEEWNTFVNVTYSQLKSDNVGSFTATVANQTTAYDRVECYAVNVLHDFSGSVRIGTEYAKIKTRYVDGLNTKSDRVQFTTWLRL